VKRKVKTMSGQCDRCKKTRVIGQEICYYKPIKGQKFEWMCQEVAHGRKCKL